MTLPPHRIGDKGQRYEVHCVGYPGNTDNVIGWHDDRDKAREMIEAILKAPGASIGYTHDRELNHIIDRQMRS